MPISLQSEIRALSSSELKELDYETMGCIYEIHQTLGRLFDEEVYSKLLKAKLNERGIETCREFEIRVEHKTFSKSYYIDHLVAAGLPYELKATAGLTPAHEAQLLNYLLLTEISMGKLINFRDASIKGRFVSTKLTRNQRKNYSIDTEGRVKHTSARTILATVEDLIEDLGTHLSLDLYKSALFSLLEVRNGSTDLHYNERAIGSSKLALLKDETVLYVTAISRAAEEHKKHIGTLLRLASLKEAIWINFNGPSIKLQSVR